MKLSRIAFGGFSGRITGPRQIIRRAGSARSANHAQTDDWLAALGATPAQVYIDATNHFNTEMEALGILSNYKMVNLYAGDNKAQAMVCNIATIGSRTLTEVNLLDPLTYGALYGFQASGSAYFTTGFKPEDLGPTGGFSVWMQEDITVSAFRDPIGARPLTDDQTYIINLHDPTPAWYGYWGQNNFFTVSEALTKGLYTVRRSSGTNLKGFKNGVEKAYLTTATTPGNSLSDLAVFARNRQGFSAARMLTPNKMGGFCVEDGLIADGDRADESRIWDETMAIMGRI